MNIYVGNLPWSIDDASLEQIFAEHGSVTSAKVITDRQTNRSRGFGFVEMSDGGENAIQALNDAEVDGRKLTSLVLEINYEFPGSDWIIWSYRPHRAS